MNAHFPPELRFYRPIFWKNDHDLYQYSPGGTANIVRFLGRFFILTAKHCIEEGDRDIADLRIPYRLNKQDGCVLGRVLDFSTMDPDEEDTALCDIVIIQLLGASGEVPDLEPGEYLDLQIFEPSPYIRLRYLSGFPVED